MTIALRAMMMASENMMRLLFWYFFTKYRTTLRPMYPDSAHTAP